MMSTQLAALLSDKWVSLLIPFAIDSYDRKKREWKIKRNRLLKPHQIVSAGVLKVIGVRKTYQQEYSIV